jgi:hypothetical protein
MSKAKTNPYPGTWYSTRRQTYKWRRNRNAPIINLRGKPGSPEFEHAYKLATHVSELWVRKLKRFADAAGVEGWAFGHPGRRGRSASTT